MIMPDTIGGEVRRLRIPRTWLTGGLAAALGLLLTTLAAVVYGAYSYQQTRFNDELQAENTALRTELEALDVRVTQAGTTVRSLRDYERRLRSLTMVHDPGRNLAIGPVGAESAVAEEKDSVNASQLRRALLSAADVEDSVELIHTRIQNLEVEGRGIHQRVESLSVYLQGQRARLASTPSRRPGPGYVSSTFGMRVDPFTGLPQFHSGVDFAANIGARVVTTADGIVNMAGPNGPYGNTVQVDHGHGLTTLYGHLSRVNVRVGDKVRRGDLIGAVGNTGRSTGPHLHYEVRLNGIPQDPSRFILE